MRIAITNAYVGNPTRADYRAALAALDVHVIGACEAQRVGKVPGYHRHGAPGHADRHARGVAVYTRHGVRVDAVTWSTLTVAAGGWNHPRTVVETRLRHGGVKWAVIEVHANPGRRGRARIQNRRLLAGVAALADASTTAGYRVVVVGDFNRRATERGRHTPTWLARRLAGSVHLAGVDGLVAGAGVKVTRFTRHPRPPGSDHPLVTARVVRG